MRTFATSSVLIIALFAGTVAFGQLPGRRKLVRLPDPGPAPIFAYTAGTSWVGGSGASDSKQGCVASVTSPTVNVPPGLAAGLPAGIFNNCTTGEAVNSSFAYSVANGNETAAGLATWRGTDNTISTTIANTAFPAIESALGEFSSSTIYYYQEGVPATPGSTLNLTFPVSVLLDNRGGFSFVEVSLWTDGPNGGTYGGTSIFSPSNGNQTLTPDPFVIGPSGTYTILAELQVVINNGLGNETLAMGCGVNASLMGNGSPTAKGIATPLNGTLTDEANACGYLGFNWQQFLTNLPCPNPFVPGAPGNFAPGNFCLGTPTPNSLTAGALSPEFNDPPMGGYTYVIDTSTNMPYNPYPYYYPVANATVPDSKLPNLLFNSTKPGGGYSVNRGDLGLAFADTPSDPCLPTGPLIPTPVQLIQRQAGCGGALAPAGSYIGFTTALVGILPDGTPSAPLYQWTWTTTWNGTAGSIAGLAIPAGPPDPGSGVGNITITSIDGIPVPPVVPAAQVSVTASGLAYSRVTGTFNGTITLTNIGGTAITTPTSFQLALNSLPAGVELVNAAGAFNQCPYVTVPLLASLMPNQSATVAVQFRNSSNAAITFTPELYAGSFQ
jgi:hypothetical protein